MDRLSEHGIEVHRNRSFLAMELGFGIVVSALFWTMTASWIRQGNRDDLLSSMIPYLLIKIPYWFYIIAQYHWKLYFDAETGDMQLCTLFRRCRKFHVSTVHARTERYIQGGKTSAVLSERLHITGSVRTKIELGRSPKGENDPYRYQSQYGDAGVPELLQFLDVNGVLEDTDRRERITLGPVSFAYLEKKRK